MHSTYKLKNKEEDRVLITVFNANIYHYVVAWVLYYHNILLRVNLSHMLWYFYHYFDTVT